MTVFMVFMEANKTAANCTIVPASVTAHKHIVLCEAGVDIVMCEAGVDIVLQTAQLFSHQSQLPNTLCSTMAGTCMWDYHRIVPCTVQWNTTMYSVQSGE